METLAFVFALGFLSLTSGVEVDVPTTAVQEERIEVPTYEPDMRRERIFVTNRLFREIRRAGLERKRDEGPEKILVAQH